MKKTQNYNLNQWEPTDKLNRADFNADNAAIDAAIKAVENAVGSKAEQSAVETALANKANAADMTAVSAALGSGGSNCRISYGSYVGAGMYGSASPNKLTFDIKPRMVFLTDGYNMIALMAGLGSTLMSNSTVTWSGNSVSWYNNYTAEYQYNTSGVIYYYVVIGA